MFIVTIPVIVVVVVVYVSTSLVNNYIIYHAHTSLESVITYDGLGRCFRFVYIYACIVVCFCVASVCR